jgi:hypothetical protein
VRKVESSEQLAAGWPARDSPVQHPISIMSKAKFEDYQGQQRRILIMTTTGTRLLMVHSRISRH